MQGIRWTWWSWFRAVLSCWFLVVSFRSRLAGLRAETFALTAQVEVDADGGVDFGGVSVEEEWVVPGGSDGVECGGLQHGRAGEDVGGFDLAGLGDDGLDDDGAFLPGGDGDAGIDGLDGGD